MESFQQLRNSLGKVFQENKSFFYIVLCILFSIGLAYVLSKPFQTNLTLKSFRKFPQATIQYRTDYKSPIYKNHALRDFHIFSSHQPLVSRFSKYDYLSLEFLEEIIKSGARYLEITILADYSEKDNPKPVVSIGTNTKIKALNKFPLEDVLQTIRKHAFSKKSIVNYTDPLFLYLEVKTTDYTIYDKIAQKINKVFESEIRLSDAYSKSSKNLANISVGEFMNKVVFLSNISGKETLLENYINMNHEKADSKLKRLHYSELLEKKEYGVGETPDFIYQGNKVVFKNYLDKYPTIETTDSNTDFIKLGLDKNMEIHIQGSLNNDTDSKTLRKVEKVYKNRIVFDKNERPFNKQPGDVSNSVIKLKGYIVNEKRNTIEEFNKNGLTIVIPDENIFSVNYNPKNMWYLGCHFVALYFHNTDENWKIAKYFFRKRALRLKQSSLLSKPLPSIENKKFMEISKFPDPETSPKYPIQIDLLRKSLGRKVVIEPYLNLQLMKIDEKPVRIIYDTINNKSLMNLSMNYTNYNSEFAILPSKNYKTKGTVCITTNDKEGNVYYLTSNIKTKELSFQKSDCANDEVLHDTNPNIEFYLLQSSVKETNYIRIGVVEIIPVKEDERKLPEEKMHYVTFKDDFRPSNSLQLIETNEYELITTIDGLKFKPNEPPVWIWRPKPKSGYIPLGDIVTHTNETPKYMSKLVSGAILSEGFDYELIWSNQDYELTKDNPVLITMWKPIPLTSNKKQYVGFGVVTKYGLDKPNPIQAPIALVEKRFTKEAQYSPNIRTSMGIVNRSYGRYDYIQESSRNSYVSFWKGGSHNFFIPKAKKSPNEQPSPPNSFTFPIYEIYRFRNIESDGILTLEDNPSSQTSSFKMAVRFDEGRIEVTDEIYSKVGIMNKNALGGMFKIKSSIPNSNNTDRCINIPSSYWSNVYEQIKNYSRVNTNPNKRPILPNEVFINSLIPQNTNFIFNVKTEDESAKKINEQNTFIKDLSSYSNLGDFSLQLTNTIDYDYSKYLTSYDSNSEYGSIYLPIKDKKICKEIGGIMRDNDYCGLSLTSPSTDKTSYHILSNNINKKQLPKGYKLKSVILPNTSKNQCGGRHYSTSNQCEYYILYPEDITTPLEMNNCREDNYFSTNFVYSKMNNTIQPFYNQNYYITFNKNEYEIIKDKKIYPVFLKKSGNLNENDVYTFNYDSIEQTFTVKDSFNPKLCITAQSNNQISVQPYIKDSYLQKFPNIKTALDTNLYCIKYRSNVLVFLKEPRERDVNNKNFKYNVPFDNLLDEVYDDKNFHMWVRGVVNDIQEGMYHVNIGINTEEIVKVPITSANIIPKMDIEYDIFKKLQLSNEQKDYLLQPGTRVVAKNGGFRRSENDNIVWTDQKVFWEGMILDRDPNDTNLYRVIFSIQSIEPNLKNKSKERPSKVQIRSCKIEDIYLLQSASLCKIT